MKYIECPNHYDGNDDGNERSLFMAGGITGCSDWQKQFAETLKDEKIVLYNPRRKSFSEKDPLITKEQISWEYHYLKKASATSFWFTQETLCPITLFELGKQLMIDKPLFIGVHPNYARKIDLEIQVKLVRPEINIVYDLDSLANQVKTWLRSQ